MNRPTVPRSKLADVVVVVLICFGWFILGSIGAVVSGFATRPFDDSTFTAIILLEVILGIAALSYLRSRGHDHSAHSCPISSYQGPLGAIYIIVFGVVLAIYYLRSKQLWPVIFAHMFTDLAGFALK